MDKLIFILLLLLSPISLSAQNFVTPYISEISFLDHGALSSPSDLAIDLVQGSCGFKDQNGDGDTTDAGDIDPEPFYDSLVSVTVKNSGSTPIVISRLYYRLANAPGKLKKWMGGLAPVSKNLVAAKSETVISFFVFKANNASKTTFKPAITLNTSLGFQDVSIRLDARTSSGRLLHITAKRGLSFGNEDRCTN